VRNSSRILLPICLLASVVLTGQPSAHDLKITTRHASLGSGSQFTTTTYYSGQNSRSEMQIFSGDVKGHRRALIRQKGAESIQVYDLDLDAHEYVSYQTDLRGIKLGAKSIAVKPSGKTYVINIDVVDTGERKEMFGHIARRLITKEKRIGGPENCYGENTESEIDGWYIDPGTLPLPQRPKGGVVTHLGTFSVGRGRDRCSDKIEVHRTGPDTGFPLKETTAWLGDDTQQGNTPKAYSSTTQVVEFSEAPLEQALFKIPGDFKKVKEIIDPTQRRMQAMTYWERFKAGLWDIFH
jgi:hypothetical protein